MIVKLMLLFVGIPLLELVIILRVGQYIGLFYTISIIIITGIVGMLLAKYQGFLTLRNLQFELSQGQMPTEALLDGLLILAGGLVLLTPGFLTDIFGFLCLLPFTRSYLKDWLRRLLAHYISTGQAKIIIR